MLGLSTRNKLHRVISQYVPREDYLPTAAEQRTKERRERICRRIYRVIMWTLLLAGGFAVGYSAKAQESINERAAHVPVGERVCTLDLHEGCLVCVNRTRDGVVISTHC